MQDKSRINRATFWKGKQVLITGHTGFKGSWLTTWLLELGAQVTGVALEPPTKINMFEICKLSSRIDDHRIDIRDKKALQQIFDAKKPEIVFHLAAQSLVIKSYEDPIDTYSTNVMGTLTVFEAARACPYVKVIVNVTSDKCYENKEWAWAYREDEPMGGYDPYSSSKGCAELLTSSYRRSYFTNIESPSLISVRAGNCIGGGDWAENRLIPDAMQAMLNDQILNIRSPHAIRPWQHVLEPLHGYLLVAEKAWEKPQEYAQSWNFGPDINDSLPVQWIVEQLAKMVDNAFNYKIESTEPSLHEAYFLRVDASKARFHLDWKPILNLQSALRWIVNWYQAYQKSDNMYEFTRQQIQLFQEKVNAAKTEER